MGSARQYIQVRDLEESFSYLLLPGNVLCPLQTFSSQKSATRIARSGAQRELRHPLCSEHVELHLQCKKGLRAKSNGGLLCSQSIMEGFIGNYFWKWTIWKKGHILFYFRVNVFMYYYMLYLPCTLWICVTLSTNTLIEPIFKFEWVDLAGFFKAATCEPFSWTTEQTTGIIL